MEPEIIVTHIANSSLAGQEQRFPKSTVTVGRDAGTDIDFDPDEDLVVSHTHAELYLEGESLFIRDLGSRNGTYVNQRRISEPVELQPEDAIHFGFGGPLAKAQLARPEEPSIAKHTILAAVFPGLKSKAAEAPLQEKFAVERLLPEPKGRPAPGAEARPMLKAESMVSPPPSPSPSPIAAPRRTGSRMGGILVVVAALVIGVGGAAGYLHLWPLLLEHAGATPSTPAATEPQSIAVAALGRLEPDGGVLAIGAPVGVTLKSMLVEAGQTVARNDALAYLSTYDSLQAELDAATTAEEEASLQWQSNRDYAAATVADALVALRQTGRPLDLEIESAQAQLDLLKANIAVAAEDRQQLENLSQGQPSTQLARQKLAEQGLHRELAAADKRVELLRESTELRRQQAQSQLQTALANQSRLEQSISLRNVRRNVARAKAQMEQAIVRAPRDGKVLKILARAGAASGGQPILQLGDTRRMYVVAEIYETDVRHVAKGQRATVTSAAIPDRLHGEVEQVLWTIDRNKIRSLDPTAPEDLRVVEVKIRLHDDEVNRHRDLLEKLINLQVRVRITRD